MVLGGHKDRCVLDRQVREKQRSLKTKRKATTKTWWRYIIAFLEDAYLYAEKVE